MHGLPEAFAEYLQQTNERPTLSLGAIRGVAPFVHDVDLAGGDTYWSRSTPLNTAVIELGRARTSIGLDPSFTVLDRADSEDRLNLVRNDLGLAKKEARFPRKQTCSPSILTR
jgi:hypothetical protein